MDDTEFHLAVIFEPGLLAPAPSAISLLFPSAVVGASVAFPVKLVFKDLESKSQKSLERIQLWQNVLLDNFDVIKKKKKKNPAFRLSLQCYGTIWSFCFPGRKICLN